MPLVFNSSLATPGVSTCSGTPNTETGVISLKTASQGRNISLRNAMVIGRGSALTTISGIVFRVITVTTASTGGTGTTPSPADVIGFTAATAVAVTGQTISATGRKNHVLFGCGAAGPGGWVAQDPDAVVTVTPNATAPSVDIVAASATASLTYEFSASHSE